MNAVTEIQLAKKRLKNQKEETFQISLSNQHHIRILYSLYGAVKLGCRTDYSFKRHVLGQKAVRPGIKAADGEDWQMVFRAGSGGRRKMEESGSGCRGLPDGGPVTYAGDC